MSEENEDSQASGSGSQVNTSAEADFVAGAMPHGIPDTWAPRRPKIARVADRCLNELGITVSGIYT